MKYLLLRLLGCKEFKPQLIKPREPKKDEHWLMKEDDSPWPSKEFPPVKIVDVQDDWVRYSFGGRIYNDERMPVSRFIQIYRFYF